MLIVQNLLYLICSILSHFYVPNTHVGNTRSISRNMPLYYAGFNTGSLFSNNGDVILAVDAFTEVSFSGITDFQIAWSYFLIWRNNELLINRKIEDAGSDNGTQLIQVPGKSAASCTQAAPGKDSVVILTNDNEVWQYRIYENSWKKVPNFIPSNEDKEEEYPVKILQGGCTVILTNLGRVFNVPTLVEMPKRVKFVDIACGFDHTILLAENGDVYSMGMGTRGQLGHGDLEDCDDPRLIEALAGIKVTKISAAGWHSAVVTDQGDLYTWGWNTTGELGVLAKDTKVLALPTLVDFKNDQDEEVQIMVTNVECGNVFTICMTDEGTLWGTGSNKYGQLGHSRDTLPMSTTFVKLNIPFSTPIKDFKCREWGTLLVTD